jgi:REP element-mobilizing transposase RayT
MPDHLHLLVAGLTETAALLPAVKLSRQRSAVAFREATAAQLWQPGYFERTLRDDEGVDVVARYIEGNPVRAGLVGSVDEWPFTGGSILRPN